MLQSFMQQVRTAQYFRAGDGAELAYRYDDFTEPGSNAPCILLQHEFPFNSNFWSGWVPRLGLHLRVARPDLRGLGLSRVPLPLYNPTLDVFVDDAVALLDHLQVEQVVWASAGTGTLVGLTLAAKHPDRVQALVLCDSLSHVDPTHLNQELDKESKEGDVWFGPDAPETFVRHGMREYARFTLRNWPNLQGRSPGFLAWYEEQVALTDAHLARRFYQTPIRVDCRPYLKDISAPTLLLDGSHHGVAPKSDQEYLLAHLPDARQVVFEGDGIGLYYSKTELCVREVKKFLAERGIISEVP